MESKTKNNLQISRIIAVVMKEFLQDNKMLFLLLCIGVFLIIICSLINFQLDIITRCYQKCNTKDELHGLVFKIAIFGFTVAFITVVRKIFMTIIISDFYIRLSRKVFTRVIYDYLEVSYPIRNGKIQYYISHGSFAMGKIAESILADIIQSIINVGVAFYRLNSTFESQHVLIISVYIILIIIIEYFVIKHRIKYRNLSNIHRSAADKAMYESFSNMEAVLAYRTQEHENNKYIYEVTKARDSGIGLSVMLQSRIFLKKIVNLFIEFMLCVYIIKSTDGIKNATSKIINLIAILRFIRLGCDNTGNACDDIFLYACNASLLISYIELKSLRKIPAIPSNFNNIIEINSLNYTINGFPILNNISFYIKKGEKIALTGENGSGKSMIVKALMNMINSSCNIIIDKSKTYCDLSDIAAFIPQNSYIFKGTVEYNIKYANMNASHSEIIKLAKKLKFHSDFMELKHGYETEVEFNGSNLSEGQKQKICILRALLKPSELLILDEPFSSLDEDSRKNMIDILFIQQMKSTVLIISHDPEIIRLCDRVIMIKNGMVIKK
ncbi:putative ABC transporter ATP-binding protein [Astathelohania contejeani]|uniref:ABC transporter ATP-binding protein n=1 Tax=Astathelohania contejeani TaxID=164912 RepID=A0ABQ7I0A1_9MICR|nr:putative ABC transporter ATP-binding protein [Thelohania contejeani]